MKHLLSSVLVLLGFLASTAPAADVTLWTDTHELFLEHSPPVAWEVAEIAVHLTDLGEFSPAAGTSVTLALLGAGGNRHDLGAAQAGSPGVFSLTGTWPGAGSYVLEVAGAGTTSFRVDAFTIHATPDDLPAGNGIGAITFTKDQQWQVPFAVETASVGEVLRGAWAIAEVQPAPGSYAQITAPVDGILHVGTDGDLALPGQEVKRGDVLARITPPVAGDGWAASQLALAQAEREFARAERLREKDAISERDYEDARTAYLSRKAGLDRLAASGDGNVLTLTAPLDGRVIDWTARPGQRLNAGDPLMAVADPSVVWLKVNVYEADFRALGTPVGAYVRSGGPTGGWTIPAGDLTVLTTGGALDPVTRTIPVLLEVVNAGGRLTLNETTPVELYASEGDEAISVPETALYEDEGRDVVFVQAGGEKFVKRPVTVGPAHAGRVSILDGLAPGERVVVRGGYFVKLAATTVDVGHGHAH